MEESTAQKRTLKFTIKLKSDKNASDSSTTADHSSTAQITGASGSANHPSIPVTNVHDEVKVSSGGGSENHGTEDERNPTDNSQYQLVLYDPSVNGLSGAGTVKDPIAYRSPSSSRPHPFSNQTPRVLPAIGAFTVQCANCFKWRLIPTKEKYEEIREHIMERPFVCENGQEWRPDMSCDDPTDITQDGSRLWAIDKPSIAQPPPGWQRLLRIRSEGSSKFADVYYVSPSGKRLRSMVEIQRYLDEHPEYKEGGMNLSKFSFQIPRPLQEDYVRKRPPRPPPTPDAAEHRIPFDPTEVKPITWVSPDADRDVQLNRPGPSTNYSESLALVPATQSEKKKKTPAKRRNDGT